MEYIISILVTILFIFLYFLLKSKDRERFTEKLTEQEFQNRLEHLVKTVGLPKENCKKEYDVKKFIRTIGFANFTLKKHLKRKDKCSLTHLDYFLKEIECNKKQLKELSKTDFSKLSDLPSLKNVARVELVARELLENNGFLLIEEKIATCFEIFNKSSTITFPEIENFALAVKYILLEKLYFLSKRAITLKKLDVYARKVAKRPRNFEETKLYKEISSNNVFLFLTAQHRGEECKIAESVYLDITYNLHSMTSTIFDGLKFVDFVDFVKFYSPLEIFENYENFSNAENFVKSAFLTEVSSQSSRLNMDEFAFSFSLKKYMNRADHRFSHSFSVDIFNKKMMIFSRKKDMRLLSECLSSRFAMNLCFGRKINKRILKKQVLKNTFAHYQRKNTVNIGISVENGKLSLNPKLDKKIEKVSIIFTEKGVEHHVSIERSPSKALYCNGTEYKGIPVIQLKDKPLDILLKLPPSE